MLKTGWRIQEFLEIPRDVLEAALATGDLSIVRKGGKTQLYKVGHVVDLLRPLLGYKAKDTGQPWQAVVEIYTASGGINPISSAEENIRGRLKSLCEFEGLAPLTPHDLRHIFATTLIRNGVNVSTVQHLLGHSSANTTLNYLHAISSEDTSNALDNLYK